MWNDTEIPLAYLITFRCYGTWLHGDERGSIDRYNNRYSSPYISPNDKWRTYNNQTLNGKSVLLTTAQRESIEKAIRETCEIRKWSLLAANVRTNHVHVVVAIGETRPVLALNALKANATRRMRLDGIWQQ
jgi:REP element-mobilizing transposase RayT